MTAIAILGALDTRANEIEYLRSQVELQGCVALIVDTSLRGEPGLKADVSRETLVGRAGERFSDVAEMKRLDAVHCMIRGGIQVITDMFSAGRFDGIIGLGGGTETTIATGLMRVLPFGVPKVMISTVASGDTRPFIGIKDITMIHSVTDILGLNMLSRRIMAHGAAAVCSMARTRLDPENTTNGVIAISRFGVTTTAVVFAKNVLEEAGYEVVVFPTVGTGGKAMEALIKDGQITGVLDLTTTELADELVGGIMSAGPTRLEAAGEMGIPQVVIPGALDMVNFGQPESVPEYLLGRRFYQHSPDATLMRTSPEENEKLGKWIAEKLNRSKGKSMVLIPRKGFSPLSVENHPFYNPIADRAFSSTLEQYLRDDIPLIHLDEEINSQYFAETAARKLLAIMD